MSAPTTPCPRPQEIAAVLDALQSLSAEAATEGRLTGDVTAAATGIVSATREVLARVEALGPAAAHARAELAATTQATHTALSGYLRLPTEFARTRALGEGQTSHTALQQQLATLTAHLATITEAVHQADAAAFLAHGHTVTTRFATGYEPDPTPPAVLSPPQGNRRPVPGTAVLITAYALTATVLTLTGACHDPHDPHDPHDRPTAIAVTAVRSQP